MNTYYISVEIYGGHVALLAESAREQGAELVAVHGLAYTDVELENMGFQEGHGAYLFRLQAESVREAGRMVMNVIVRRAGERMDSLGDNEMEHGWTTIPRSFPIQYTIVADPTRARFYPMWYDLEGRVSYAELHYFEILGQRVSYESEEEAQSFLDRKPIESGWLDMNVG